ncbi:MAG: Ig-like domain-containing protein [Burkholderiales bacterium]|nr:Ig-like domain-containing protein [Burkholderiales bacterium]
MHAKPNLIAAPMRSSSCPVARAALAVAVAAALAHGLPALAADAAEPLPADSTGYAPVGAPGRTSVNGVALPLYPMADPRAAGLGQASSVLSGQSGAVDYAAARAAARLVVEVERNAVPADGQTPVEVTVRVMGADGRPLTGTVFATIEHSGGRVLLDGAKTDEKGPLGRDADRVTPGVQLPVQDGVARFRLLAPMTAQDVQLRVTVGGQEAAGVVSFVPEMRDMVAAGLIDGIINFRGRTSGVMTPARHEDAFDREIRMWSRQFEGGKSSAAARAAFFLKGTVQGKYLLTAAYDSDKETRSRLLRDIRAEEFYPVYGDASLRGRDAISDSRLYVRIDENRNYLLWGDFSTGDGFTQMRGGGATAPLAQRSLGNYNRTATGVRYHHDENGLVGNVFAFRDTLVQVVEEFASQGSGPYGLRNNAVLEGTEKVEVIVRDRDQPSRILSATPLALGADYTFEPFSGRILLATFLPSTDSSLNPVSLRVTYEVDQGGDPFWVVGADGQLRVSETVEIGGSVVKDDNPLAGRNMASANIGWRISPETMVVAEVARTSSEVNTNPVNQSSLPGMAGRSGDVSGNAWRLEMAHKGERTEATAFIGRSDTTFDNLSAPLTGGRGEASLYGAYQLTEGVKLYAQAQRSEDRNPGASDRSSAQLGAAFSLTDRLTLDVGLRAIRESAGTTTALFSTPFSSTLGLTGSIATGSGGSAVGFGTQVIDPVSGLPVIVSGTSLGGSTYVNPTDISSETVRVGLGFRYSERLTLGGEVEHDIGGESRRRIALGGDYQIAERTRLYGRYERQTGLASPNALTTGLRESDAFVFGVNSTYLKDTQLFSEYRLRDAVSGRDLQMASGVRNMWDLATGLRLNTALERVRVVSGDSPDAWATSVGVDWFANPLWRASTKVEYRRSGDIETTPANEGFDTTLWQAMVARKLDRDWTLLARNYLLRTAYDARGGVLQNRAQLGVAYRDTDTNRVNALAKYEYKTERDASNASVGTLASRAHIVSLHADYHPSRPWWMTGRAAGKWQADRFENGVRDRFNAQLLSGRIVYDITEKWDVGVMTAVQFGQRGARQSAYGVEAGYQLSQNLWLSVGYNRAGFSADRDLAGYEYTRSGVYLRLRFKFDEDLFATRNPSVNPVAAR